MMILKNNLENFKAFEMLEMTKILPVSYIIPYITSVNVNKSSFENLVQGKCVEVVVETCTVAYKRDEKLDDFSVGSRVHCVFENDIFAICEVVKSFFTKKNESRKEKIDVFSNSLRICLQPKRVLNI